MAGLQGLCGWTATTQLLLGASAAAQAFVPAPAVLISGSSLDHTNPLRPAAHYRLLEE